jgi:hypothetical protein
VLRDKCLQSRNVPTMYKYDYNYSYNLTQVKYAALVSSLADLISPTNSASSGFPTLSNFEQNAKVPIG